MKNILAIPGSLRAGSSNHSILEYFGDLMPPEISYTIYDGLRNIPAFDPALDDETPPTGVADLRAQLNGAHAIIICTPEYAHGVPGALKNALDWMVSSGSFSGKPVALITASTGGEDAHEAMIKILNAIDATLSPETMLLIPFIRTKITERNIVDPDVTLKLQHVLKHLLDALRSL
ncbi:MAG: NAD(P)H-dependent oxidoreductase [Bacteroidetes bacterium]|nr:NAD(P)H-dependent oxidoreductase [Bacteroidota bacterium]